MSDKKIPIILASQSPRRRQLLGRIVPTFAVVASEVDERTLTAVDPVAFAREAAVLKARGVGLRFPDALILGSDTVVTIDGHILGKPTDEEEAWRMLRLLSGREHRVVTAVAVTQSRCGILLVDHETTRVIFKILTEEMIRQYVEEGTCMDKAGSYAIQDVGDRFIERIEGDYENVVGLPLSLARRLLFDAEKKLSLDTGGR
jgi:septum formation protein